MEYTVTNTDSFSRTGIVLESTVPDDIVFISEGLITGGGDCPGNTCDIGESITWNIGALAAGTGFVVSIPPLISSGSGTPPDGTAIIFNGRVLEGTVEKATDNTTVIVEADPVLELAVAEDLIL